jgi:HD superfamily phosphohydrolase
MGWLNSANTGKGATASYQQVSVPTTTNVIPGYSTASVAGQLQIAAQGATVDINDSVMTNNLQALGTIRANQTSRQTDIANLEAATQTQDASQQTVMATLQRINQALLLQLRTQQDANQINANLALQQIVAQKQQQDAMKSAFRDSAGYENYYNANITTTSSGSGNLLTQAY